MDILLTITGIQHYVDSVDLIPNQEIILRKEPLNKYDEEAIIVYVFIE